MLLTEGRTLGQCVWATAVPRVELGADKGVYLAECNVGLTRHGPGCAWGWYQIGEGSHPSERGGSPLGGVAISPPGRLGEELKLQQVQDDVRMTRGAEEGIRDWILGRGVSMSEGSGVTRRCAGGGRWLWSRMVWKWKFGGEESGVNEVDVRQGRDRKGGSFMEGSGCRGVDAGISVREFGTGRRLTGSEWRSGKRNCLERGQVTWLIERMWWAVECRCRVRGRRILE